MKTLLMFILLFSFSQDKILVKDPWMRLNAKGMSTALFLQIENKSDLPDTLYKVECNFAERAEIHETYEKDGMMGMRAVDFIVIPPKSTFELKPRSHHIMVIKLKKDITKNSEEEFILYFKNAGKINIKAIAQEMMMKRKN